MAGFSIVTNVPSLLAQDNLNKTNDLQQRTITRLTSGLRINSSADDAAGLAIANRFRSDVAVLQQGIRNAADGLSTLQIIDGGINNISLLLDRARTLATQSGSGTFSGDRSTLNSEFQSVLTEIDRQAQAIGLNPGGEFNALLSVFIGGGRESGSVSAITNGSVQIDLSDSAVNSNILGLKGVQALGVAGTDIGGASTTSVETVVEEVNNLASLRTSGFTEFLFAGPGFSDDSRVRVAVNLSGIVDTNTLVAAINAAIEGFSATSQAGQAFTDAGITASVNTDSSGLKQLSFTSGNTAFQVAAGDRLANALLGSFQSAGAPGQGATLDVTVTGDANQSAATAAATVKFLIQGAGLADAVTLDIVLAGTETADEAFSALQTAIAGNTALATAGITATSGGLAADLVFTNSRGERFDVFVADDSENVFGFGTFLSGDNAAVLDSQFTGTTGAGVTQGAIFTVALPGGAPIALTVAAGVATLAAAILSLNAQIAASTTLSAAGLVATNSGGADLRIASTNGTDFRLTVADSAGAGNNFGFGDYTPVTGTTTGPAEATGFLEHTFLSGGATASSTADVSSYAKILYGTDDQTITITANDATGRQQSVQITLRNDDVAGSGGFLDEAIQEINRRLQESNNSTLQQIVAVKERNDAGSGEGLRLLSTLETFKVSVSSTAGAGGLNAGAQALLTSDFLEGGGVADISSKENAERAVGLLAAAVNKLAAIQADVGKGQNNLQFAISLATTQVTNLAAAEGRIRDADLAAEAANLVRTQIQQQAGVAALAQANSAPQAVLALLQG